MIKQISLIPLVVIGIGALGTILTPAFATVPPGHGEWGNPGTGSRPDGTIGPSHHPRMHHHDKGGY
jgi:hypothetical protein